MREHHIRVARTARYHTFGSMHGPVSDLWFVCHGYGQLARWFLHDFRAIEDDERLIVAPEGLSRYYTDHEAGEIGASWMTREDREREIDDYIEYLDTLATFILTELPNQPDRVRFLGFSQGGATVTRWAIKGQVACDQLILWGAAIPPDIDEDSDPAKLNATDLTVVVGERDQFVAPGQFDRERERLDRLGIRYRLVTFPGGHRLDDDTLRALARENGQVGPVGRM